MTDLTRSQLTTGIIPSQSAEILPYGVFDGSHIPNCSEGDQHTYPEESGKYDLDTVSVFVAKLYQLLDGDEYKEYLTWNDSGDVFVICNMDEFAANVLPKFFKHCKFTSFVRQLNIYGFYRVSDARKSKHVRSKHACVFSHPQFRRGRQDLLPHIRRRVSKPTRRRPPRTNDADTSFGVTTGPKSSASKESSMTSSFNSENGKDKERAGEEGQMRERIKDLQEVTENLRKDLKQMNSIVSEKLLPEVKSLADGLHRHQQHLVALTQLVTGNFPEGTTILHEALRNLKHAHPVPSPTLHDTRGKRLRLDTTMATTPAIKSESPLQTNLSTAALSPQTIPYSIYTPLPESYKNDDLSNQNHNDPNLMSSNSPSLGNTGMENTNVGPPMAMESHAYNQMIGEYQQLSPQQPTAGTHASLGYSDSWAPTATTVMLSETYAMFPHQSSHSPVLYSPSQPSPVTATSTNQTTHSSTSPSLRSNHAQSQPHRSPVPSNSSPQLSSQSVHQQQPSPTPTIALSPTGFVDTSPRNEHLLGAQGKRGSISGHASPGHEDLHVGAPSPASPVSSPPEGMTYYQGPTIVPINMYNAHYSGYPSM